MKLIKKPKKLSENMYANLDEVMDFSVPFELIYSGVENDSYFDILYDLGIRNFLMSYHYICNRHLSLKKRFENEESIRLFIDSGAHTYQNDPKYAEYGVDYWEEHLKKYLSWAERNKDFIFAIANFDFVPYFSFSTTVLINKFELIFYAFNSTVLTLTTTKQY